MKETVEVVDSVHIEPVSIDLYDIDAFVRVVNIEKPVSVDTVTWEKELIARVDLLRYWIRMILLGTATFVVLGFSLIGMIATIAHFACG